MSGSITSRSEIEVVEALDSFCLLEDMEALAQASDELVCVDTDALDRSSGGCRVHQSLWKARLRFVMRSSRLPRHPRIIISTRAASLSALPASEPAAKEGAPNFSRPAMVERVSLSA